jgi:Uma2 family endonuclease
MMAATLIAQTQTKTEPLTSKLGDYPTRLFTASEYQKLAELGVLNEDERLELIEGRIVRVAAKNMNHAFATKRANRLFAKLLGDQVVISVQDPILLNNYSEPEPDIVLAAPPEERYLATHPTPKGIFLVLEIAEDSLAYDRDVKCPLFAENGIVQFCLLNLQSRELEDYREPSSNGYRRKQTYTEEQSFTLVAFPNLSIQVKDLLPPLSKDSRVTNDKRRKK